MTITWYGQSCFRIDTRETVLAIDPFSKEIGLTPPRFRADAALVTHSHADHAHTDSLPGNPFVINGPGEYEFKGIAIRGIPTFHDTSSGAERGLNTAFRITTEDITLAHLGDFGEAALRDETAEALGEVDILFIPTGGTYTIDGDTAAKLVHRIEPRIVIPMHYGLPGLRIKLSPVERFLNAYGTSKPEVLEKLVLRKKDLPQEKTRVVVLRVE